MAIQTLCARLLSGHDATCEAPVRRYHQQAVLINKTDIIDGRVTVPTVEDETGTCNYRVSFALREGATGYRFMGSESGSVFFGYYDKARNDLTGNPEYTHNAQILLTGASENAKCILESLDKGSYVVALQLTDGTVEIYGFSNGMSTGDYTYNLQEGGGGSAIVLSSQTPENRLPYVYESANPGAEGADFDALFANTDTAA